MIITLRPSKQAINGDCTCTFNAIVYFHGLYQHTTPHTTVEMTTCKNSHSTNSAVGNLLLQCIWVTWDNKYQIFCLYYSLLNMLQPREGQKWRLSSGAVAGRVSHGVKHIWMKISFKQSKYILQSMIQWNLSSKQHQIHFFLAISWTCVSGVLTLSTYHSIILLWPMLSYIPSHHSSLI